MASYMPATKLAELLRSAGSGNYVWILENSIAIGRDPSHPSKIINISKETIEPYVVSKGLEPSPASDEQRTMFNGSRIERRSRSYWFELRGKRTECGLLKQLLAEALKALEQAKPGTLENLARIRGRNRRIVARDPNQLFSTPRLAGKYAQPLIDGWYYGTNNSAPDTSAWLHRATECAGLNWGTEFITSLDSLDDIL